MKKQIFILFSFIIVCNSCDLLNLESPEPVEIIPIKNCAEDISNIPPINILWEKDLNSNGSKIFSPIIYKNFVLAGNENTLSFFNKETGSLEKTLEVTFPNFDSHVQNLDDILQGNCFIKGEHLIFDRYFEISSSYSFDTVYTELLNLETGNISRIAKRLVSYHDDDFDENKRIHLLDNNYLQYELPMWTTGLKKIKLVDIFDGTETLIGETEYDNVRENNISRNNDGDTLITSFFFDNHSNTPLRVFNISKNKIELDIEVAARSTPLRSRLLTDNGVIYFRGVNQLVAVDIASKSILWEKPNLKSLYEIEDVGYHHNVHITDKYIIDFSRNVLNVFDKNSGELIFEEQNMPDNIKNIRTVINNDELIVADDGLLRVDLNNGCAIWQTSKPSSNQGFSGIVTQDETLNRLYAIKEGKLVCIQL